MNIFHKRPLALVLCIGLCGFFLFAFEDIKLRLALMILAFLPLIISLILKFNDYKKTLSKVITLALLMSYLCSFLYFDNWFKAYKIYDGEVSVIGTVEQIADTNSYTRRLLVRVEELNGERHRGYKFYAYTSKADAQNIITNTRIRFDAILTGFSEESISYNISKGINAYASDTKNIEVLEQTDGGLQGRLAFMKEYMARYTVLLSDGDSGGILSALLIGEREYLPDQVRLDFKRIGISHILALSGLHLAILSVLIERLLSFMKVKKKARLAFTALFILFYMALTGFSASVVRAGIMVILSCVLFLASRSKDSITSLSMAVFIICLFKPHAIFDISLQLSSLSTFGIIAFAEFAVKENLMKNQGRFVKYLVSGILTSVFAISATIWISTSAFGGFSLLGPFATLIFSPIVELVMNLGTIMLFVGWLIPVGKIINPLCNFIIFISSKFSSLEWAYVSSNFKTVGILIAIYTLCFYAFFIFKLRNPKMIACGLLVVFCVINIAPTVMAVSESEKTTVAYSSGFKSDEIVLRSCGEVCLINSSQYSKSLAYDSLDLLEEMKITYVHKYYLTHYSWSMDDELVVFLSNIAVDEIYLPTPRNDDEQTLLRLVCNKIDGYRTRVITYGEDETVCCGEFAINLLYSAPYGETSINALCITRGEDTYTYLSSGILEMKDKYGFEDAIRRSDYLILGEHGKKYKDEIDFPDYCEQLNLLIIHSDKVTMDDGCASQYENKGCEIYSHPSETIYLLK